MKIHIIHIGPAQSRRPVAAIAGPRTWIPSSASPVWATAAHRPLPASAATASCWPPVPHYRCLPPLSLSPPCDSAPSCPLPFSSPLELHTAWEAAGHLPISLLHACDHFGRKKNPGQLPPLQRDRLPSLGDRSSGTTARFAPNLAAVASSRWAPPPLAIFLQIFRCLTSSSSSSDDDGVGAESVASDQRDNLTTIELCHAESLPSLHRHNAIFGEPPPRYHAQHVRHGPPVILRPTSPLLAPGPVAGGHATAMAMGAVTARPRALRASAPWAAGLSP
jgi:hypothetical protein